MKKNRRELSLSKHNIACEPFHGQFRGACKCLRTDFMYSPEYYAPTLGPEQTTESEPNDQTLEQDEPQQPEASLFPGNIFV